MPKEGLIDQARDRAALIIEKRLKEEKQRILADVVMRDIIVVGAGDGRHGEFYGASRHKNDKIKLRNESEVALVRRMASQIKILADKAAAIHLADNFERGDPLKMLPYMKNHVTRLTTNEFYFYPYKKRGPLSAKGFNSLVERINIMAMMCPDNLHLVLASFPVVDAEGQVRNLVVHVQCGLDAKLYVLAKAMPADSDLWYKETKLPYFNKISNDDNLRIQAGKLQLRIIEQLKQEPPVLDRVKLGRLKKTFELLGVRSDSKAVKVINQWLEVRDDLVKLSDRFTFSVETLNFILIRKIKQLVGVSMTNQNKTVNAIRVRDIKAMARGEVVSGIPHVNYGGYVPCVTRGGAVFPTIIDICLDHAYGIAMKMHRYQMSQAMSFFAPSDEVKETVPFFISNIISQLVISNTIELEDNSVIGESVVHADPEEIKIQAGLSADNTWWNGELNSESKTALENASFGSASEMSVYPTRVLGRASGELGYTIERLNASGFALQMKLMLARQYPAQADMLQEVNDIKLRMAVILEDFDQVDELMLEGANIAYRDADGVSTLLLIERNENFDVFMSTSKLLAYFVRVLSTGDRPTIIQVVDEMVNLKFGASVYPVLASGMDRSLMYEFLRVGIRRGDELLVARLIYLGVDPLMVDAETKLSLFNEALVYDSGNHAGLRMMFHYFSANKEITTDILIKALYDVKEVEKALRMYLLVAMEKRDQAMLSRVVALGANYLGENPMTGRVIAGDIFGQNKVDYNYLIFDDALSSHKMNELINFVLMNDISFDDIVPYLEHALKTTPDCEQALLSLIEHLVKISRYDFLVFLCKNKSFMKEIPESCQHLIAEMVDYFKSPLICLVNQSDDVDRLEALLASDTVNVNLQHPQTGATALHAAIKYQKLQMLVLLLKHGADPTLADRDGVTPLVYARQLERYGAIKALLKHLEPEAPPSEKKTKKMKNPVSALKASLFSLKHKPSRHDAGRTKKKKR